MASGSAKVERLKARQQRIKALVAEMLAEEAADGWGAGPETIDDIENTMIRIGDAVAREVGAQKLARHTDEDSGPHPCPHCGEAGVYLKLHSRGVEKGTQLFFVARPRKKPAPAE